MLSGLRDGTVRVLIIDDDPVVRGAVGAALSSWPRLGSSVAISPAALDERLRSDEFELVVLDSGASDHASLRLLEQLKAARPDVPVVMISRHGDEQWAVHAIQAGAVDFIPIARIDELLVRGADLAVKNARLARELYAFKTDLVGIVSHDIRAPTSNVLGYVELLLVAHREGRKTAREGDYLVRIQENARFILRLVDDLIDMARIESGGLQLTLGLHDVGGLGAEAVERCAFFARSKGVKLVAHPPAAPETATVDRSKVVQILTNLIGNAIKFSHEGSFVTLRTHVQDRTLTFRVEDQGVGIAPADLEELFKKFSPVSSKGTRGEKGSGLGLYIVEQFVRLHHGSIQVESCPDVGSAFIVTIPQDRSVNTAPRRSPVR